MAMRTITDWASVPIIMDLAMAGRILGLTVERLRKLSRRGEFPAIKVASEWRVDKDELIEYMRTRRNGYARPVEAARNA